MISEFIYDWLKDIVVFFIIITLIELIMPKGKLKRYMNFIIGLILIFMVISPFLKLFSIDFKLEDSRIDQYQKQEIYDIDFTKEQTERIEDLYIEKIDSEINKLIEKQSEYKVKNSNINIDKDEENFGEVNSINIELTQKNNVNEDKKIKKINISKINDKKQENNIEEDQKQFKSLKKSISEELDISMDLITIYTND